MSQPHQKIPELCRLLGGLYIGHAIRPSTCAEDVEVTPRLEPTSKCMSMFFWCVWRILSNLQAFLWEGVSLAFFGPILLKIERKVENHRSHSTINILGFVLYKYQLSAVLNSITINYGQIIGESE